MLAFWMILCNSAVFAQKRLIPQTLQTVKSPDGKLLCQLYQKLDKKGHKAIYYTLSYKNTPIILESALDIQLDNHLTELAMALKVDKTTQWCEDMEFLKASSAEVDSVWKPLYGERSLIKNRYTSATLSFQKSSNHDYKMDIQVRLYNEGLALRYFFPVWHICFSRYQILQS